MKATSPRPSTASRAGKPSTDSLTASLTAAFAAVRPHLKTIATAAAVVLIIALVASAVSTQKQNALKASFAALSAAETEEDFEKVAEAHKGSLAAHEARLRAAHKLFDDGDFEKAQKRFAEIAANVPRPLLGAALNGQAYALEALGRLQEAGQKYGEAAQAAQSPAARIDALCGAGRCAKAREQFDEAEKWYKEALDKAGDDSRQKDKIEEFLKALDYARTSPAAPVPAPEDASATEKPASEGESTPKTPADQEAPTSENAPEVR